MDNQFSLLKQRRFLPFFIAQFLGAFNDNLFKQALIVMVAYGLWNTGGWKPEMVVSLAAALFIFPFIIFAPIGGDLADRYDKAYVIRAIKLAEIGIVVCAILGLVLNSLPFLLFVLFALGAQSAIFSPSKLAILPQHLKTGELIAGNALVNTGTYLAILAGTILGGLLALEFWSVVAMCVLLVMCGFIGCGASFLIPSAPPGKKKAPLNFNILSEVFRVIHYAYKQERGVFAAILGVSWFYFVGGLYLSQFPNFTKQTLGVDHVVLTFFMALFSIGIALGGLLNNRLLKGKITARFVPWAALGIGAFSIDLYFASGAFTKTDTLMNLETFLHIPAAWRIIIDLLLISLAGGIYVVPLTSIVQHRTPLDIRARVIAGNTILNAVFIFMASIMALAAFAQGLAVEHLFVMVGGLSLLAAWALYAMLAAQEKESA